MKALKEFADSLDQSGLISSEELDVFQSSSPDLALIFEPEELASRLVEAGKLTPFQVDVVMEGRARELVLGQYEILDKLGAGGMGVVYRARHRRMKREVALKVLQRDALENPVLLERFHREVQAAAKLTHPHIVTSHDADEWDGVHYLVMEYIAGHDLQQLVKAHGPLKFEQAAGWIMQAAQGLGYAHTQGIVHRDIKPANLLIDEDHTLKILDMGLARFEAECASMDGLTHTGQIMGTVDFMAPEQASDTATADARSDIYSLGCTFYFVLTAKPVFPGNTIVHKIMAHARDPRPSLQELRTDLPVEVDQVLKKMMAIDPADRFQSMAEVVEALEWMAGAASVPPAESSAPAREVAAPKPVATGRKVTVVRNRETGVVSRPRTIHTQRSTLAAPRPATKPTSSSSSMFWMIMCVFVVVGFVAAGVWIMNRPPEQGETVQSSPSVVAVPEATPDVVTRLTPDGRAYNIAGIIDPVRDVLDGTWSFEGEGQWYCAGSHTNVGLAQIPLAIEGDFRLTCELTVYSGFEWVSFVIPVGGSQARVVLASHNNNRAGLGRIQGKPHDVNLTTRRHMGFTKDKRCRVMIEVRTGGTSEARVIAERDGDRFVSWTGPVADLDADRIPNKKLLGLGSARGVRYHSVELLMLEGEATLLPGRKAAGLIAVE